MPEPDIAKIRPFVEGSKEDDRLARFYIGTANMEGLAAANFKVYTHPVTLAIWVALSCILVQYLNWWPRADLPWWNYLKPVPAFGAWSMPIMALTDWYNRPYFEEQTQNVLRKIDMVNIYDYYFKRSPASGFWILEYGDKFVGFIAIDASADSTFEERITSGAKKVKDTKITGTSSIATIRHFYVYDKYRPALAQDDLLRFAVEHAFTSDKKVMSIHAADTSLASWASAAYRRQGFIINKVIGKVGVLGWPVRSRELSRKRWESRDKGEESK